MMSEHPVQRGSQGIEIAARLWHALQLLGWRIANRHDDSCLVRPLECTCNTKVNQFDLIAIGHHNVRWFEIAEDDWRILVMQIAEHATYLLRPNAYAGLGDAARTIRTGHSAFFLQHLTQRPAVD